MKDLNLQGVEKDVKVEKILISLILIKIQPDPVILREYYLDFSMPNYE